MGEYAQSYPQETLAQYPDFISDWQQVQQKQAVESSSMGEQFTKGFHRGMLGLESSGAGFLSLLSDTLGAQGAKEFWGDIYKRKEKQLGEEAAPSVPTIQQAFTSFPAAGQYLAGKAGEILPNVGEAMTFAAAGTLAAPGPGTEAGGVGGFFARGALRSALKKLVEKEGSAVVRKELEDYAAGAITEKQLAPATAQMLTKIGKYHAATAASMANFAALGAGGEYGALSGREGVTPEAARAGALIAGAGASLGAVIPAELLGQIFGKDVGVTAARSYVDKWLVKVPEPLLTAGGGMGAMEFFNILGERYADPKLRDKEWTKEEWSRLLNATATGILMGIPSAAVAGVRPIEPPKTGTPPPGAQPPPPEGAQPPPSSAPAAPAAAVAANYPVTGEQRILLRRIAEEVVTGKLGAEEEEAYLAKNPGLRPEYQTIKSEVSDAIKTREESVQRERERADAQLLKERQDREQQAKLKEEGAKTSVSHQLSEEAGGIGAAAAQAYAELPESTKATLASGGITEATAAKATADKDYAAVLKAVRSYAKKRGGLEADADWTEVMSQSMPGWAKQISRLGGHEADLIYSQASVYFKQAIEQVRTELSAPPAAKVKKARAKALAEKTTPGLTDEQVAARRALVKVAGVSPEEFLKTLDQTSGAMAHSDLIDWMTDLATDPNATDADWSAAAKRIEQIAPKSIHEFMDQLGIAEKDRPWKRPGKEKPSGGKEATPQPEPTVAPPAAVEAGGAGFPPIEKGAEAEAFEAEVKAASTSDLEGRAEQLKLHLEQLKSGLRAEGVTKAMEERWRTDWERQLKFVQAELERRSPAPPDTSWVATVPAAVNSWKATDQKGSMFLDVSGTTNNKETTNGLGVFEKPDGRIAVVTIKETRGKQRVQTTPQGNAQTWEDTIKAGWKPIGRVLTGTKEAKRYYEYSKEQWADIQKGLEEAQAKAKAEAPAVPTTKPAEVPELRQAATAVEPKAGQLSEEDAGRIHDLVVEHVGGLPKAEDVREFVGDAISTDPNLMSRLRKAAAEDYDNFISILDQIYNAYDKATHSGETDPAKLRGSITKELAGIRPEAPKVGKKPAENVPVPEPGKAKPGAGTEHLATPGLGFTGDPSSVNQAGVRDTLAIISSVPDGRAYDALVALKNKGLASGDLVDELIRIGDKGATFSTGGEFVDSLGRKANGKYNSLSHHISIYDEAFNSLAGLRSFLHEYLHSLTVHGVESGRYSAELDRLIKAAREEATKQKVEHYGLGNREEFLAEANTNGKFQEFLDRIRTPSGESLWSKFIAWVGKVLGIKNPSILDEAIRISREIAAERPTVEGRQVYAEPAVQIPDSARTYQFHSPAFGTKDTAQSYNPVTGRIETEPVIQDSVEAALHNVKRESSDLEYLLPSSSKPPMPAIDPAIEMTNEHAINNKTEAVRTEAAQDAGVSLDILRRLFGLHDTAKIREALAFRESVEQIQGVNRGKTLETLIHPRNRDYAMIGALKKLWSDFGKITRGLVQAKDEHGKLEVEYQDRLKENTETLDNLEDASFMAKTINSGFKKIIESGLRSVDRLGQQLGIAMKVHQELEGKLDEPIDQATVNVFRKLASSEVLQGDKLFDLLDGMANDPAIDFSQPATQIRDYIRHVAEMDPSISARYTALAQDTPEAKALLSTVIGYGKLNRRVMTLLEVRKMNGPDRVALKEALREQRKLSNEQLATGVQRLTKAAKLQERALAENRESLRQVRDSKRKMDHAANVIAVGEAALPHYDAEINRLTPKIQQTEDSTFTDGMVLRIPKSNEAKPEWEELKLNLQVSSGKATTNDQLKSALDKMVTWAKLREQSAEAGDDLALGMDYQRVMRQVRAVVEQKMYAPMVRATDHTLVGLYMGANGKAIEALGTPTAQMIGRQLNKFAGDSTNLRNQSDREFGYKNSRLLNKILSVLNEGQSWWQRSKVQGPWFDRNILNAALGFLERGLPREDMDIETARDQWFSKLGPWLLQHDDIRPLIHDRMPQFMAAMRELADSIYLSGQWWVNKNVEAGMLVKDPRLGGRLRKHVEQGLWTFQRKFSDTFSNLVHVMRLSGWAPDEARNEAGALEAFKNVALLESQDPTKVDALIKKYLGEDTIQKDFLFGLTHTPDGSVFRTPALDDSGTRIAASPTAVATAYEQTGGDVRAMVNWLHDYYNGQDAKSDYLQDTLLQLASVFKEINGALNKVEPRSPNDFTTFVGMVPNAMIDARRFQHLPSDWFNYHRFDNNDNARIAERTAWQINMGREGRDMASWFQTAVDDNTHAVAKFDDAMKRAADAVPSGRRSEIKKAAERMLADDPDPLLQPFKSGTERLKFLQNQKNRSPFLQSFLRGMATYFNRGNQPDGSLRWGIRASQELASLLVNQPSSAISQLATTVDIMIQWGLSPTTVKATARTIQMTSKDIAGSLAQGVGWEFLKPSYYEKRFNELGLASPITARRMADIFTTMTGEEQHPGSKFWRQTRDIQSLAINLKGEKAAYTPFQPFAPFFQFVTSANRGLFVSLSEMADNYITRGVEFLKAHPGVEKITAEDLGLNRWDRNSFDIWQKDHARYGLDFNEMVRGAKERMDSGDKTVLTDKELGRIYAVGLNVISLESNIATMPLWAFNNNLVRFGLPLLGWSYRRAGQLAGLRLNTKDQVALSAVANGLLGVAATGLGGLGLSLIVDAYSNDVLGKKRNIRPLRFPTTGSDWQGIEERLARVGTFGMWGELLNSATNVGTGQGDNRMLSVDQRVVAMQSFQGILKAASALINQGFDPDYQHVVRPMVASLGGNGMLQYMQIMNHAFDLDNVESRVVKRINAENYLRVVGRDLGMSIRSGGGGYATPTPITPWIARMEYAAYANDPEDFRNSYQGALAEAKKAGKENPTAYVKQAFETRHPLRFVFSVVPSEREYRVILGNLDDDGREDVTEAIRLFNYYGSRIGLTPFQGSVKKNTSPAAGARARAMALAY